MSENALGMLAAWPVYDPRSNPLSPPGAGIFDFPRVCIPVNVEWVAHIAGVISRLEWEDAWIGSDEEKYLAIQEILKLYEYFQEGKCEAMLRQSPVDPCVWEQSLDGGDTWTSVFDLRKCKFNDSPYTLTQYIENTTVYQTDIDDTNIIYDNDVTNVTNNWGYDGTEADGNRDAAMCYAIGQFIDLVCAISIKQIEDGNAQEKDGASLFSDVEFALSAMAGGLFALKVAVTATGIGAVALAATGILTTVIPFIIAKSTDVYTNEENKDALRCKIYGAMSGSTPTFSEWSGALNLLGGGNDWNDLNDAVRAFMQDSDLFIQWMIMVDDVVGLDIPNTCAETCCTDDYALNFLEDSHGFVPTDQFFPDEAGVWQIDNGWVHTDIQFGSQLRGVNIMRTFDHPVQSNKISLRYDCLPAYSEYDTFPVKMIFYLAGVEVKRIEATVWGSETITRDIDDISFDTLRLAGISCYRNSTSKPLGGKIVFESLSIVCYP